MTDQEIVEQAIAEGRVHELPPRGYAITKTIYLGPQRVQGPTPDSPH